MAVKPHQFRLEAPPPAARRVLSVRLAADDAPGAGHTSVVTITRVGTFTDPRYGEFAITPQMLAQMVTNFKQRTYGQDIFIDVAHRPDQGAAARVLALAVDGGRLRATVEWTEYGIQAVRQRGFTYLSAEFVDDYIDNERGQHHGPVLLGAGLTVRPVIKRLDPVQLSAADGGPPLAFDPLLLADWETPMKDFLKKLRAALEQKKTLSEDARSGLLNAFEASAKLLGDDPDPKLLQVLLDQFLGTAEQVAKANSAAPVTLSVQLPEAPATGLNAEDVKKLLAEQREAEATAARQLAETKASRVTLFNQLLDAAEGLKSLSESARATLKKAADLITPAMSEAEVKQLAEFAIEQGNQLVVQQNLRTLGWQPAGSVHIQMGEDNSAKKLQEIMHQKLKLSSSYGNGQLKLPEKVQPFVDKVLAEFDQMHGQRIYEEARLLAGETTAISDTNLPVAVQREVIRETLSDLRVLELVQTNTDPSAQGTTQIPYETRDGSAIMNDGVVFEGNEIHGASVQQDMDLAYIVPMKVSMNITEEVMHFSASSMINWDAWGRNVASNARFMRELIARRIANNLQRSADAAGAVAVSNESMQSRLDGNNSIYKTTNWPIIRPFQQYDMKGTTIGGVQNPITVSINGNAISQYDGTGTQSAGTYWRIANANLGYIQFVDEDGAAVTPTYSSGSTVISYSYSTNVRKFDLDIPEGLRNEEHLNGLLQAVGAGKAYLNANRYVMADFLLMSATLNDITTNAENYTSAAKRPDADLSAMGDLATIKATPAYGTNAPNIDLGDERILIGPRGLLGYTIAKPYSMKPPFEAVGANGKPTGKLVSYGTEFSAIHVPSPVRNRMHSVIAYSLTGRTNA